MARKPMSATGGLHWAAACRVIDQAEKGIDGERLGQDGGRLELFHTGRCERRGREHDDRDSLPVGRRQTAQQLPARQVRETDVEQHEVRHLLGEGEQGISCGICCPHGVTVSPQRGGENHDDRWLVINEEHPGAHDGSCFRQRTRNGPSPAPRTSTNVQPIARSLRIPRTQHRAVEKWSSR